MKPSPTTLNSLIFRTSVSAVNSSHIARFALEKATLLNWKSPVRYITLVLYRDRPPLAIMRGLCFLIGVDAIFLTQPIIMS